MTNQEKYQVYFADCYVLTNKRNKSFIISFLDHFVPNREEYVDEYEIPQFSNNPTIVFKSVDQLIEYLENNKKEVHAIYWSNKEESTLRGAMCFFNSDEQIVLGVYCETKYPDTTIEDNYLKQLIAFCNSGDTKGLILYEEPAPKDTGEFLERVKVNMQNKGAKNSG